MKGAGNAVILTFPTHWSHGLQHLRCKRRNVRFKGLRRVHTPPQPLTAHTAAHRAKQERFGWGRYYCPRSVLRGSETLRGRVSERHTLPLSGLGRVRFRRAQRACGTAMRSCASLSRGVAAPLGCVIPWLFPSPHRWVSRFSLVTAIERREHICRFHTLVCSMRLAARCRSCTCSAASNCR